MTLPPPPLRPRSQKTEWPVIGPPVTARTNDNPRRRWTTGHRSAHLRPPGELCQGTNQPPGRCHGRVGRRERAVWCYAPDRQKVARVAVAEIRGGVRHCLVSFPKPLRPL